METEKELNKEILDLTTEIRTNYPELNRYIDELTISIPDSGRFDLKVLKDYRDTLKTALLKYKNERKKH
jgi:hypothetical protein